MILSVIINHYQTPEILKLCLRSLIKNLPENIESEIIVADSETQEKTKEMIRENFPQVLFVPNKENIGFGKSVNKALRIVKGDYILIINADIIIAKKETIGKMIDYFQKNPQVGLLGPNLLNINGAWQPSCFRFYTPSVVVCRRTVLGKTKRGKKILKHFLMKDIFSESGPEKKEAILVDWLMGSVLFTKREALEKVGYFDERFFMYFEDIDWCRRFWQAGYKIVYFPASQMYHYHMQASRKKGGAFDLIISKYARIHLASAVKYFLKWGLKVPSYGV